MRATTSFSVFYKGGQLGEEFNSYEPVPYAALESERKECLGGRVGGSRLGD